MDIPFLIWRVHNRCFKYNWLVKDLVMLKVLKFFHNLAIVVYSTTSLGTSLDK